MADFLPKRTIKRHVMTRARIVITSKITAHQMVLTTVAALEAAAIAKQNEADEFSFMRALVYMSK